MQFVSFGNLYLRTNQLLYRRIIDAQSVKNTDTAMEKGYDAGKKVSGIKRHIAVDTQGLPHALAVTTADITDRKGCLLALERGRDNLGAVQKILADGGYTGKAFASSVQEVDWCGGRDCQTKRIALFCSIAETMGS
ncbi:Mobile element protein [Cardiobacterium hominis]|uniref:Mobile element protein n=1 Tax=Cardiobacterium hominis TaxID=2718 RepID=A0A1C3H6S8_9GAMM|nr:Mobile element protein [Cardiobacterium hominis]